MKTTKLNPMMYFEERLEHGRKAMLSAMADAVGEARLASDEDALLTEDGEAGLLRLLQVLSGALSDGDSLPSSVGSHLLADVLAQLYAFLALHPIHCPMGLALYSELEYMMQSLMLGDWYDGTAVYLKTVIKNHCGSCDTGIVPLYMDLCWDCVYLWTDFRLTQHGDCCIRCGGIDYLFSAKWTYLAVDCLFDKSLRSANGSNLAVGKGTGLKVCNSGFSV